MMMKQLSSNIADKVADVATNIGENARNLGGYVSDVGYALKQYGVRKTLLLAVLAASLTSCATVNGVSTDKKWGAKEYAIAAGVGVAAGLAAKAIYDNNKDDPQPVQKKEDKTPPPAPF